MSSSAADTLPASLADIPVAGSSFGAVSLGPLAATDSISHSAAATASRDPGSGLRRQPSGGFPLTGVPPGGGGSTSAGIPGSWPPMLPPLAGDQQVMAPMFTEQQQQLQQQQAQRPGPTVRQVYSSGDPSSVLAFLHAKLCYGVLRAQPWRHAHNTLICKALHPAWLHSWGESWSPSITLANESHTVVFHTFKVRTQGTVAFHCRRLLFYFAGFPSKRRASLQDVQTTTAAAGATGTSHSQQQYQRLQQQHVACSAPDLAPGADTSPHRFHALSGVLS